MKLVIPCTPRKRRQLKRRLENKISRLMDLLQQLETFQPKQGQKGA